MFDHAGKLEAAYSIVFWAIIIVGGCILGASLAGFAFQVPGLI
jgi:hypothetical protein